MSSKFEIVDRYGNPVDDDILPDGGKLRVPMMLRDADGLSDIQRGVIEDNMCWFDDSAARHQQGPVFCTDRAGLDAKRRAYQQMCDELQGAWKTPSAPAPDHAVTSNGWKTNNGREVARLHDTGDPVRDAYLDSVADLTTAWRMPSSAAAPLHRDAAAVPRTMGAADARRIKDAAWNEMVREMVNAWRGPVR